MSDPAALLDDRQAARPVLGTILGPDQVVEWGPETKLLLHAPAYWRRLSGPVGTVCITGDDRVGKSTLLSQWATELAGPAADGFTFPAGHTRTSFTRGLWSAMLPAQTTGLSYNLNICDSQGLKQVSELEQWRLFSANVLIPSVLVYMVMNVIQNDQVRDLAQFAQQFQRLSAEDSVRFGAFLSPTLIVVIREENAFATMTNATDHLEQVLGSSGFREDKDLVRKVFSTREAWSLEYLPAEARQALRDGVSIAKVPSAEGYRRTAHDVLDRVKVALRLKSNSFPQNGLELADWYHSVVLTVNSHDEGAVNTLVNHAERLADGKSLRHFLENWRGWGLASLLAVFGAHVLGGFFTRWLENLAWCAWLVACVCYVGTSQLVTAPLGGFVVSRLCDARVPYRPSLEIFSARIVFQAICREASPYTAAVLVSLLFGIASYSLVVSGLRWQVRSAPAPTKLLFIALVASEAFDIRRWGLLSEFGIELPYWDSDRFEQVLLPRLALFVAGGFAAGRLVCAARQNRRLAAASREARAIHSLVHARIEEVRALQASQAWSAHYRDNGVEDAIWRYRCAPIRWDVALVVEIASLGAWSLLIYPHCDGLLAAGAVMNALYMAWLLRGWLGGGRRGSVASWLASLQDAEPEELSREAVIADEAAATAAGSAVALWAGGPILQPETEEETRRRLEIEAMRQLQERLSSRAMWWKKRR